MEHEVVAEAAEGSVKAGPAADLALVKNTLALAAETAEQLVADKGNIVGTAAAVDKDHSQDTADNTADIAVVADTIVLYLA